MRQSATSRRPFTWAAVAAAALLLAACSLGRFAYNNASPVVTYLVDDYFDLSGDQEDWVRERFERLQAWHRATELPAYERDLREAIARTERPLTIEDARWVNQTLRASYRRLIEHALPDMAELLVQLDAAQAKRFAERFDRESEKIAKESAARGALEQRQAKRVERMVDQVEGYTGRLDAEQRAFIARRMRDVTDVSVLRLADRQKHQDLVLVLVRSKPPKAAMEAGLRRALVRTESWRSPEYEAAIRRRDEEIGHMIVALSATWTPEQRAAVQKKLRGYLNDVSSLKIATR